MTLKKKLIEVALPLAEINSASAYDKMPGIGPHPKGIHHWWARLPLPAARAVLFASVVDDPSEHPEQFPTEEAQRAERERLFAILRKMMQKQLHKHPEVYVEARNEMLRYCDGRPPAVLDPFSGGGSIPLEATRLGFAAYAADLNPISVLLNRCNLELIPRCADRPPVNPKDRELIAGGNGWSGASGLAADVRYYARIIGDRAREEIGHLYPKVRVTNELVEGRDELKRYIGQEIPVVAWIWARTVASPNPAARRAHIPLMSTYWLSSKKGSEVWLDPVVDRVSQSWQFAVRTGPPADRPSISAGTKLGRGARFRCILTGDPIEDRYIKEESRAGQMHDRLVAVIADGSPGRIYIPASPEHEEIARQAIPIWFPDTRLAHDPRNIWCVGYGLQAFAQLFTPRQLTALSCLSDLVRKVREGVRVASVKAGLSEREADTYASTVTTFLALALDRCADFNNSLCRWKPSGEQSLQLFSRQAIPMVWDFVEPNILGEKAVCWQTAADICADAIATIAVGQGTHSAARQVDAAGSWDEVRDVLVSTDPPYYDNISYAALSDFFHVWLRRTIGDLYPDLFQIILTPKGPELVAAPERFGGDKRKAKEHFETGFRQAFTSLRAKTDGRFPLTVYYAFKQDDEKTDTEETRHGSAQDEIVDRTTGWETMLEALITTGFQITGTWPIRASQEWRMVSMGTNALASYIVLVCRPRSASAPMVSRREFIEQLKRELPDAIVRLQSGNIAPVDLAQAALGPGMAVYTRYSNVLDAAGKPLSVREALALINQTLDEVLAEQEGDFDADSRWALAWFEQFGFAESEFGVAETLSKAKNTSVGGMVEARIVASRGGRVRLLRPSELAANWDPAKDPRLTAWEMVHQLIRALEDEHGGGEETAAALVAKLGGKAEVARELAYRLYTLCERKKRAAEALSYNALVQSWPEIARLARAGEREEQGALF